MSGAEQLASRNTRGKLSSSHKRMLDHDEFVREFALAIDAFNKKPIYT